MTKILKIDEMIQTSHKVNESYSDDSYSDFFLSLLSMYESDLNKFDKLCPDLDYGEDEFENAMSSSMGINNVSDITNTYYQSIFDTYIRDLVENKGITQEEAELIEFRTRPVEFYYDGEEFSTTEELMDIINRKRTE